MRFNAPEEPEENKIKKKWKMGEKIKNFLFSKKILIVILFLALAAASPFAADKIKGKFFGGNAAGGGDVSGYDAVFLDNGQVYFGKMISKSDSEIVLSNVYYLQANDGGATTPSGRFTLIKLGQELHGPTDEMMINMQHVVFYEKLRKDSKVVESIKQNKN